MQGFCLLSRYICKMENLISRGQSSRGLDRVCEPMRLKTDAGASEHSEEGSLHVQALCLVKHKASTENGIRINGWIWAILTWNIENSPISGNIKWEGMV